MYDGVRVAYVLRSWPRLSQTFILNEILGLEQIGVGVSIFALARSGESIVQPQVADVRAPVRYLDATPLRSIGAHLRLVLRSPRRYVATFLRAFARRDLYGGYTKSGPARAFGAAVLLADQLGSRGPRQPCTHIHAHFAHDPALVGLLASRLADVPFTFTAHARDVYQIPARALRERARVANAIVACCRANADHIRAAVPAGTRVELIYHGVDLSRFTPAHDHSGNGVPLVLSVGRLVEKKGFDDLLRACALVAGAGHAFRGEICGEGPLRAELESLRDTLGLRGIVHFSGARTQAELLSMYQKADIFAMTPRVTDDGDRDGVPNVFLEAMACATPVLATRVGGIDEVVHDGSGGVLVASRDAEAIAAGLVELLDSPATRRALGATAAATARQFDGRVAATRLAGLFSRASAARA